MRRYIATLNTEEKTLEEIIAIFERDQIKIEKYLKYIDTYVLLSKNQIPDYPFISEVFDVDHNFGANDDKD